MKSKYNFSRLAVAFVATEAAKGGNLLQLQSLLEAMPRSQDNQRHFSLAALAHAAREVASAGQDGRRECAGWGREAFGQSVLCSLVDTPVQDWSMSPAQVLSAFASAGLPDLTAYAAQYVLGYGDVAAISTTAQACEKRGYCQSARLLRELLETSKPRH